MVYTNFNKKRNRFNNKLKFKIVIIYNDYKIYYIHSNLFLYLKKFF